jgi:hypothetical protein
LCDVDSTSMDVGGVGRNGERTIFKLSRLGRWLEIGLDSADPDPLPLDGSVVSLVKPHLRKILICT